MQMREEDDVFVQANLNSFVEGSDSHSRGRWLGLYIWC